MTDPPSTQSECTCSEDRNGGDPHDHAVSCPWANEAVKLQNDATLQECLWVAKDALGQIERGAPSAYWRGLAEDALKQIAEMEGE